MSQSSENSEKIKAEGREEVGSPSIIPNLKILTFLLVPSKPLKGTTVIYDYVHESGYRVTSLVNKDGGL